MTDLENIELISELITGRVKPHIYAFTTNTIPNYLKVGDTYRALTVRLNEWRKHFPNLQQVYSRYFLEIMLCMIFSFTKKGNIVY